MPDPTRSGCRVGLFATCLVDLFRPEIGFATANQIEQAGCCVSVSEQTCCGQPAYNSGDDAKARVLAKNLIKQFEVFDYVIVPSGSCAGMIKCHYPKLFIEDKNWYDRAQALADKTYELSQFLVEVIQIKNSDKAQAPEKTLIATYHDSCSGLRELGIRSQPRQLLKQKTGIDVVEMDNAEICCGFGGTFCVKYPEISTRLVDNKITGIENTSVDILLGGDLGCLMNIAGRLKRQDRSVSVFHYAEVLDGELPGSGIAEKRR